MSLSKPASHRVLFNEDYLHMIFPYLATDDLKSSRLVTPFWNKIATKFLGRKSFKPIRFSDLTYEEWVNLKREIEAARPEEDPRIKLLQGFHLTWVEAATAVYCSFMTPFKPSQIIISDLDVSPGSTLTSLLTQILETLSDLTLKIKWDFLISDSDILGDISSLQGMRLKRLHLEIWKNDKDLVYRKEGCKFLNDLLANQAPTLEELHLNLGSDVLNRDDKNSRIQFPIFHRLTSLTLKARLLNYTRQPPLNNFAPFDFCQKFPNLLSLDIDDKFLREMSGEFNEDLGQINTFELTKGHPLKIISIDNTQADQAEINEFFTKLEISFPQVEEFAAQSVYNYDSDFPWVDTLKNIKISNFDFLDFNLVHLKNLESLEYMTELDEEIEDVNEFINMLLEHYRGLLRLKSLNISGVEMTAEQRNQVQEALPPQFRDILTIKPNSSDEDTTGESDTDTD